MIKNLITCFEKTSSYFWPMFSFIHPETQEQFRFSGVFREYKMGILATNTAQRMKFSIKDLFTKCDQIRSFLRIWSHLLKKSLVENFIFCAVKWFCRNFILPLQDSSILKCQNNLHQIVNFYAQIIHFFFCDTDELTSRSHYMHYFSSWSDDY